MLVVKLEWADKPGSVVDDHSSRPALTHRLQQPTRVHRGPRYRTPIWSCSRRGFPCHFRYRKCGALLPHLFTLTGAYALGGIFSVALSVGSRPPAVNRRLALWSPDFPPRIAPRRSPGPLRREAYAFYGLLSEEKRASGFFALYCGASSRCIRILSRPAAVTMKGSEMP